MGKKVFKVLPGEIGRSLRMAGCGGRIPDMIMDYALYRNGERALDGSTISELIASARKDGGFLWVGSKAWSLQGLKRPFAQRSMGYSLETNKFA